MLFSWNIFWKELIFKKTTAFSWNVFWKELIYKRMLFVHTFTFCLQMMLVSDIQDPQCWFHNRWFHCVYIYTFINIYQNDLVQVCDENELPSHLIFCFPDYMPIWCSNPWCYIYFSNMTRTWVCCYIIDFFLCSVSGASSTDKCGHINIRTLMPDLLKYICFM